MADLMSVIWQCDAPVDVQFLTNCFILFFFFCTSAFVFYFHGFISLTVNHLMIKDNSYFWWQLIFLGTCSMYGSISFGKIEFCIKRQGCLWNIKNGTRDFNGFIEKF